MINEKIVIEDLFSCKEVKDFCNKNKLTNKEILKNIVPLSLYKDIMEVCSSCNGKKGCLSSYENMTATLVYENNEVKLKYLECNIAKKIDPSNLEVYFYTVNDEEPIINDKRSKLFTLMQRFIDSYDSNKLNKGFYIYGTYGIGKSFLAYNFAQKLTQKGIKVIFAYYPDLIRQIKNNMGSVEM